MIKYFFHSALPVVSYTGLGFAFLALTGEVIELSQPVVTVVCWIEEVYVADEHLEVEITLFSAFFFRLQG